MKCPSCAHVFNVGSCSTHWPTTDSKITSLCGVTFHPNDDIKLTRNLRSLSCASCWSVLEAKIRTFAEVTGGEVIGALEKAIKEAKHLMKSVDK